MKTHTRITQIPTIKVLEKYLKYYIQKSVIN